MGAIASAGFWVATGAGEPASSAFWAALRTYIADNRYEIAGTRSLLDALDAATPLDLWSTMFRSRFPRLAS